MTSQTREESIVETVSLSVGNSLPSFLRCYVGSYSIVLKVNSDLISTQIGLSYSNGVYYPVIGMEPPNSLILLTSIVNGSLSEIQFTFISGPIISLVFDAGTNGLRVRNDSGVSISNVILSVVFNGLSN